MKQTEQKPDLAGRKILLCVTGGIAAYKSVDLASKLAAEGAKVKTVMTEAACQLVGPKSFEAVTDSAVFTSLWETGGGEAIRHVGLVEWAEIVVVAPATADIIAKFANGICDDLVSTVLCVCWSKPIVLAPAMNVDMWNNPAVQRNVNALKTMGVKLIGPAKGRLACGVIAEGRMSEPQEILDAIEQLAGEVRHKNKQ
jgi:phosphopantothenoylcysteine decarboxylase/phosphopantothenate--cysteine ligase